MAIWQSLRLGRVNDISAAHQTDTQEHLVLLLGMPNDRQDQRNTMHEHPRFDALWNDSGMHNGEICPPEPAHQRALNLLPMEGDDEQAGSMSCALRDKKRGSQRIAAGKKSCDDEEGLTQRGGADLVRSLDPASGTQLDGGREYAGGSPKKMRKKSKRIVHKRMTSPFSLGERLARTS